VGPQQNSSPEGQGGFTLPLAIAMLLHCDPDEDASHVKRPLLPWQAE